MDDGGVAKSSAQSVETEALFIVYSRHMFQLFPKLPPELRHLIWRLALPDNIRRPLHLHQRDGYWRVREIQEHEPTYQPGFRCNELEFRTELIDPVVQLRLPQFFVNHEAHDIAAAWLREQGGGFVLSPGQAHEMDRFVCPFNTERDTLYISPERWPQFAFEPGERLRHGSQLSTPYVNIVKKNIRLAMPDAVFWDTTLLQIFPWIRKDWFSGPGKVFVILGLQPEHDNRYWWDMEDTELGALV
ncbi:hypothetical protein E4U48_005787 [Claviceps purpurea]|nr:hypothetical protein E4U48_005787 [Claviceps purpurea]